jgi:hypothetical protein
MITATVVWHSHEAEYLAGCEARIEAIMHDAVEAGAKAAQAAETRFRTGDLNASIHAGNVRMLPMGAEGTIVADKWYAIFQNWGTLGQRTKPLKQARRASRTAYHTGAGISPLYFMEEGEKVGFARLEVGVRKIS